MCKEILRQLHEIHQGAVHTNQNTSGTTVWLNHVFRNEIKCDIVHWDDVGQCYDTAAGFFYIQVSTSSNCLYYVLFSSMT